MEKYIYDNNNGLWYELHGDYYIPLLTVPEVPPLGIWGRRRLHYLKAHRPVIYNTMLLSGELFSHLAEIDKQAGERYEHIETNGRKAGHYRGTESPGSNGLGRSYEQYP